MTAVQDAGEWIGHHLADGSAATGGETADVLAAVEQLLCNECRMFPFEPFAVNRYAASVTLFTIVGVANLPEVGAILEHGANHLATERASSLGLQAMSR